MTCNSREGRKEHRNSVRAGEKDHASPKLYPNVPQRDLVLKKEV
jgi:hypothetical protein